MESSTENHHLPVLINGADKRSRWSTTDWPAEMRGGMSLSPRIDCSSLRLRSSKPGYFADWHVAGEPVLIIIRQGTLRIGLQDETARDFQAGDAFIVADKLNEGQAFDPARHGHTATVMGEHALQAIHIKLVDPQI